MIPALTAANLLAWSLQLAVVAAAGGAAVRLVQLQSPRVRLACFRALLVACLLLPFLPAAARSTTQAPAGRRAAVLAGDRVSPAAADSIDVTPANASPAARAVNGTRLPGWAVPAIGALLLAGFAARLAWLLIGLLALRRLRREASTDFETGPAVIDRAVDLAGATADVFVSRTVRHPVTFGLRHPVVLLPESCASLEESEQVAVVCHELLHVRRHDWLHIVGEELLRAVLWFHPAVWWLLARIDLSREQVVDQEVVALTERRRPYVSALVTLAMTPGGPILRPASLFLGRAHLLQRVALLSREVRMSRPRLCLSVTLVVVALVASGGFVVHAFPLAAAMRSPAIAAPATPAALPTPAASLKPNAVLPPLPSVTAPAAGAAALSPQTRAPFAEVLTRAEPIVPGALAPAGADLVLAAQITVQSAGDAVITGPVQMFAGQAGKRFVSANADNAEAFERVVNNTFYLTGGAGYITDGARAVLDALRSWRFVATEQPFTTVIGFNLARGEQSGSESVPVRVGSGVPMPVRIRNVQPVYPLEAQDKGIQGVVILDLVIDGAGIPISAYAVRPIEGLTMAAVQAALQWRYQPDANYNRRLMTVTVNFTLVPSPPPQAVVGGVESGIVGGVAGGMHGGVASGVVGGVAGGAAVGSFGPPRAEWPSNAIRVGGDIRPPTRIKYVNPAYPAIAVSAKVQGVVIVEVLIGTDGTVQAGQILRSIPLLDQAALDAVGQWQYTPTLLNGNPVPVIMTVTVNFTLR